MSVLKVNIFSILYISFVLLIIKDLSQKLFNIQIVGGYFLIVLMLVISFMFLNKFKLKFNNRGLYIFAIITFFVFFNSFIENVEIKRFIFGYYYTFLFYFIFLIFSSIRVNYEKFYLFLKIFIFFHLFIAIIAYIEGFLQKNEISELLKGISSIYLYHSYFGAMIALAFLFSLILYRNTKNIIYLFLGLLFFITIFFTGFRKTLSESILIYLLILFLFEKNLLKRYFFLIILSFSLFILFVFAGDWIIYKIEYTYTKVFDPTSTIARTILFVKSFEIANDYFPLGSGLGTFASLPAAKWYSDLYFEYNLNSVYGLYPPWVPAKDEEAYHYLVDTYYPHIFAELGYIGSILFFMLLFFPLLKIRKNFNLLKRLQKVTKIDIELYIMVIGIYIIMFFECLGGAMNENLIGVIFWWGILGIIFSYFERRLFILQRNIYAQYIN